MSEQMIWNFLRSKLNNSYGTAALMGNLYVESKFKANNLQGNGNRKLDMTDEEYTEAVDNGSYTNFVHDGYGYGLAQWTHWSRKEKLLEFAKETGASIGDLNMQLVFLWKELQSYKTCLQALKGAVSVREASNVVVERYEKPADQSEKAKQNRANYGVQFYNKYSGIKPVKTVSVTHDKVNIRVGNGTKFDRIFLTNSGQTYPWVATAENGWHAVLLDKQVGWISGEFSKVD